MRLAHLAGVLAAGVLLTLPAADASAAVLLPAHGAMPTHAVLAATNPQQGSEIQRLPPAVTLEFGEAVSIDVRSLQVLSPAGHRVDSGRVVHPRGVQSDVATAVPATLPRGSYTVVWRVISADSHPVAGTFAFGYGVPAGAAVPAPRGSVTVGVLNGMARFAGYTGLVLAGGVIVFAAVVWPGVWGRRRIGGLLVGGLGLLAGSSVALLLLAGPYDAATGLSHVADGHLLHQTLTTRYGKLVAVRLLITVLGFGLLAASRGSHATARRRPDIAVIGVVTLLTYSLSQHAGTGSQVPLAAVADVVHLSAVVAWVGGLVVLLAVVLDRREPAPPGTLRRWSRLALGCVVVIVASGAYASWREVGTLPAFSDTAYGRLLLIKMGLLVLLIGLGWVGRRLTHRADAETASTAVLCRSAAAEVLLSAGVLVVAAILVDAQPARAAYDPAHSMTIAAVLPGSGELRADVHVDTTRPGRTDYTITVTDEAGKPQSYQQISALLSDPAKGLGPIRFTFPSSPAGTGTATGIVVPGSGRWQLDLQIRTDAFTSYPASTTYLVR